MPDPVSFADLTSTQGWATVDYERTLWIPNVPALPDGCDTSRWARDFAAAWWSMSGLPHGENEIARLEAQLACIRDGTYGHLPCHLAYIHLPDPRMDPLPVFLAILAMDGPRDAHLRLLTSADDPSAVRPPIVEEFSTDRLGTGLRVLRYFAGEPGAAGSADGSPPGICAGLSYAWRSEQHATDLLLFTASPDPGRLERAIPDIDELARQISVISAAGLDEEPAAAGASVMAAVPGRNERSLLRQYLLLLLAALASAAGGIAALDNDLKALAAVIFTLMGSCFIASVVSAVLAANRVTLRSTGSCARQRR